MRRVYRSWQCTGIVVLYPACRTCHSSVPTSAMRKWCSSMKGASCHMVSMANLVVPLNLPQEEMIGAQRAEAAHLVEEARLAEVARRADAANLDATLEDRN
ncbi:hypothetical protein HAX54_014197 [Datura stramonium]|uniref:Uncharacterized protein n=1 Tax=Datura stramonium TaxID=4076 RepID=A0ABS8TPA6_DATST|nr:hypothetical protein [Datura stramonium]